MSTPRSIGRLHEHLRRIYADTDTIHIDFRDHVTTEDQVDADIGLAMRVQEQPADAGLDARRPPCRGPDEMWLAGLGVDEAGRDRRCADAAPARPMKHAAPPPTNACYSAGPAWPPSGSSAAS